MSLSDPAAAVATHHEELVQIFHIRIRDESLCRPDQTESDGDLFVIRKVNVDTELPELVRGVVVVTIHVGIEQKPLSHVVTVVLEQIAQDLVVRSVYPADVQVDRIRRCDQQSVILSIPLPEPGARAGYSEVAPSAYPESAGCLRRDR